MPVITRIITDASGSSRRVNAAVKSPDAIQVKTVFEMARDSAGRATSCQTMVSDTRSDPNIVPHATAPAAALLTRLPRLAFSRKPRNGSSGMRISIRSPFQARERIRVERFLVAEQADHDRETDGGFGGRDGHHEEHDDLAVRGAER